MKTSFALLACCLILSGCAPRHPEDMNRVNELRTRAERFIKAQSLMGFQSWALGAPSNQDSLYAANATLFTRENLELVARAEHDETDSVQQQRLFYFRRYLTFEYISKAVAPLTDSVANYEAKAAIILKGKEVPYRQALFLLSNEPDHARRLEIYAAASPVLDTLNMLLTAIEEANLRISKELGYASYTLMVQELKKTDYQKFQLIAERVLTETDSVYQKLLAEQVSGSLHMDPADFEAPDAARLFRNPKFDRYFPAARLLPTLKAVYHELGVEMDAQTNLQIDAEDRPAKNPRAVCFPIDVPNDIRLSIKPVGGRDDYAALFHEAGHAEHYANTKEHSFEFCYAGEPTVTETFAFLSEYLLENQAWLRLRAGMPAPAIKELVRSAAFQRLWYVRRYCAKFLYELQLHDGVAQAPAVYGALMSRATGYKNTPALRQRYLVDVDPFFYSASYLRAWFLEAQLTARLTADFGPNWFEYPGAGAFVRSLWSNGDRLDGDELARTIGAGRVSADDWLLAMKAMVLFSTP